ncbi:transcriptional regulator with XRE-family HTH domain [Chryseobacterium defluvii]|uniref:Transcriptional regulator with XRE-family HTH domain n=1 Tax=Chryseobacterium defluvii TaxID=160396 RepID=A0A840KCA1_9FLAO|nr:helix-turn-helix transcriptional regulator [Chryseobacterium defluvii]MBB4807089.1 transcriptional regulator with XRE-family HTH domain [Chryseobacterium defluvii]
MIIGHKIKNIRELKNLTQEYMAERLDISQSAYSKLEKESNISDEKLQQIAEALEVKPDDIMAFDSQKYFNSFNNVTGDKNGSFIIEIEDTELIKKLYDDKIALMEELMKQKDKELEKYRSKYGEL